MIFGWIFELHEQYPDYHLTFGVLQLGQPFLCLPPDIAIGVENFLQFLEHCLLDKIRVLGHICSCLWVMLNDTNCDIYDRISPKSAQKIFAQKYAKHDTRNSRVNLGPAVADVHMTFQLDFRLSKQCTEKKNSTQICRRKILFYSFSRWVNI